MAAGAMSDWKDYDAELDRLLTHATTVASIKSHVGADGDVAITGKRCRTQVVAGLRAQIEAEVSGAGIETRTVYVTLLHLVAQPGNVTVERTADTAE